MSSDPTTDTNETLLTHPSTPTPMPTHSLKRLHFLVHGTVQGVFFRKHTHASALNHGITGYVHNLTNGKVAGEAQGTPGALEKFLKDVDRGSPGSHVIRVDRKDLDVVPGEESFQIRKGWW